MGSFWLQAYPRLLSLIPSRVNQFHTPTVPLHTPSEEGSTGSIAGVASCLGARWGQLHLGNLRLESQWIDGRFQADDDMVFTAQGESESLAIVSPKTNGCTSHKASGGIPGPSTRPAGFSWDKGGVLLGSIHPQIRCCGKTGCGSR